MKKGVFLLVLFFAVSLNVIAQVNGLGTETNPYLVTTVNDLYFIAERINSGDESFSKAYYLQTNNIVINESVGDGCAENEWTPIGTNETPFQGEYNGGKFYISGVYINNETASSQGLFGCNDGVIKYVGIVNSSINSYDNVGAICGRNNGHISYCYSVSKVKGVFSTGGICGDNYKDIEYCYNLGSISGAEGADNATVGGIVGLNAGSIRNCYNAGQVFSESSSYVGGISGVENLSEIDNCYNIGQVFGGSAISAQHYNSLSVYYDNQISVSKDSRASALTTTDMVERQLFENSEWEYSNGLYPQIKEMQNELSMLYATPIYFSNGETSNFVGSNFKVSVENGVTWTSMNGLVDIDAEGNVVVMSEGDEVLVSKLGEYEREILIKIVFEPNINGVGTSANPYKISSAEELIDIANKINNDEPLYDKLCYKVVGNIVFNTRLNEKIKNNEKNGLVKWIPIKKFSGKFDFGWVFIEGLYSNQGLFEKNDGEITNVYIVDSYINGTSNIGAICGINNGLIKYCQIQNTIIDGLSNVAGICGENNGEINTCINKANILSKGSSYTAGICASSKQQGIVVNCENRGVIKGNGRMGGICAAAYGVVEHCVNKGSILPYNENNYYGAYVGGVCGIATMTTIKYCVNAGLVVGEAYTGGIVGLNSMGNTENCYNIGTVVGDINNKCGAIIGQKDPLRNCYYDSQTSGIAEIVSGATGLRTKDMTSGNLFGDSKHWSECDGSYPNFSSKYISFDVPAIFLNEDETINNIGANFNVDGNCKSVNGKILFEDGEAIIYSIGSDTIVVDERVIPIYIINNPNEKSGDVNVSISSTGSSSLYHNTALLIPEGVKAYYVGSLNEKEAKMVEILNVIPANTGVILVGEEGDYLFTLNKEKTPINDNLLRGSIEDDVIIVTTGNYYKLSDESGEMKLQKDECSDGIFRIEAGRAYLFTDEQYSEPSYILNFEDFTTSINAIQITSQKQYIFDLYGRKVVGNISKGIYIVDGKKRIMLK